MYPQETEDFENQRNKIYTFSPLVIILEDFGKKIAYKPLYDFINPFSRETYF
jgi:hypothetical protein